MLLRCVKTKPGYVFRPGDLVRMQSDGHVVFMRVQEKSRIEGQTSTGIESFYHDRRYFVPHNVIEGE